MKGKMQQTDLEYIAELALNEGRKSGCTDVSVVATKSNDSQVRFSNNNITLVNNVRNITLGIYLAKDRKRIVGTTYNPTAQAITKFIENLSKSCESLPPSEDYVSLPAGPFNYQTQANFDPKVADAPLVECVKQTIDEALQAGAGRVSGSLNTESTEFFILTSAGASGRDRQSQMLLNVRAFTEDNASGHGLSCTSYVSEFEPGKAGRTAGSYAKRSVSPKALPEGKYNVVFSSTVIANILPVANSASAFAIESGNSFLADKLDAQVGVRALSIDDYGVKERGLGGRIFDDEGYPTQHNMIVADGVFRTMLHNTTTAKKFGKKTTGNAGIISPQPITIVFKEGNMYVEEMVRESKEGVFVSNNWYTRFQNMRSGDYSTVPRDAAFRIEGGEIKEPLTGLRVSDSIPRQLSNIEYISRERDWIKWWEVNTPTLAPAMMIKDVPITRAVGS